MFGNMRCPKCPTLMTVIYTAYIDFQGGLFSNYYLSSMLDFSVG